MSAHLIAQKPRCPTCSVALSGAGNADGEQGAPKPGDFSICVYCTTFLRYTEELGLREATKPDLAEMDRETLLTLTSIRRAICRRGGVPLPREGR